MTSHSVAGANCPITPVLFRHGMTRIASAVHVIAIRDGADGIGVTATAVCSLSDAPASLLVCLHRDGRAAAALRVGISLSVNALSAGQIGVAKVFAGEGRLTMTERFTHGKWSVSEGCDAPVLEDALAWFQCRVTAVHIMATHCVAECMITATKTSDNQIPTALLYGNRKYHILDLSDP